MNPVIRNFKAVIRRYRLAFVLNLAGLAVALYIFSMIMMQLRFDYGFDRELPRETIFLLISDLGEHGETVLSPRPLLETIVSSVPGTRAGCLVTPDFGSKSLFELIDTGSGNAGTDSDNIPRYQEMMTEVSAGFEEVFGLDFLTADQGLLKSQDALLIPESIARKWMPGENPVGRNVRIQPGNRLRTIAAVYRDFPANSSLPNAVFSRIPEKRDQGQWTNLNYMTFIRTDRPEGKTEMTEFLRNTEISEEMGNILQVFNPISLRDLHFAKKYAYDCTPKADARQLLLFLSVAILVLAVACINFTNFSTAAAPLRLRCLNTMKVLGSRNRQLRTGLVLESVLTAAAAWVVSVALLFLLKDSALAGLIDPPFEWKAQMPVLLAGFGIALLAGTLSGLWPAWFTTAFPPALAIKGNFALSPRGKRIRTVLVSLQFVASFLLTVCSAFILLQNRYLLQLDTGFDRDRLLLVTLDQQLEDRECERFREQACALSGVESVAFSNNPVGIWDFAQMWGRQIRNESQTFHVFVVSPDLVRTLGLHLTEGRDFLASDSLRRGWIFNERARLALGLTLQDRINGREPVLGFVEDFHYMSMKQNIEPMGFYYDATGNYRGNYVTAYVRLSPEVDPAGRISELRELLEEIQPGYPFRFAGYEDLLRHETYIREINVARLLTAFTGLAILIALIGVFGLVVFDNESRKREIAVRKVHGAGVGDILLRFNRHYLILLAGSFLVAAPLSVWLVLRWLDQFPNRVPFYGWVLPAAFLLTAAVTLATVTGQSWRNARMNPADNLKAE